MEAVDPLSSFAVMQPVVRARVRYKGSNCLKVLYGHYVLENSVQAGGDVQRSEEFLRKEITNEPPERNSSVDIFT